MTLDYESALIEVGPKNLKLSCLLLNSNNNSKLLLLLFAQLTSVANQHILVLMLMLKNIYRSRLLPS